MFEIYLYEEVYAVLGGKSVRGSIITRDDDGISVAFENGDVVRYTYADAGEQVFTTEKALIKKLGSKVTELAPPKRKNISEAIDYYGLPVKEGDYVVAISGNPLYCRVEGKIEKIYKEYSEYHPEIVYVDLRKKSDQTFTKVPVSDLCLQTRFA